jgi:hypothetical protein
VHISRYTQANVVVDRAIERTKELQARLPHFQAELDDLLNTLRLSERKLAVAEQMLDEAAHESKRCVCTPGGPRIHTSTRTHNTHKPHCPHVYDAVSACCVVLKGLEDIKRL